MMKRTAVIFLALSPLATAQDNVLFVPSEVNVYPHSPGTTEVWVSPITSAPIKSVDMVIGSDSLEQFSFTYAQSFLDASAYVTDPPMAFGIYPTDLVCGGFLTDGLPGPVLLGTVVIYGDGLAGGEYDLLVDSVRDIGFSTVNFDDEPRSPPESLMGSAIVVVHDGLPDPGGAQCQSAATCDDGNPCTRDECVSGSCTNTPDELDCDDGVFCNGAEICLNGNCLSDGSPCAGETPVCCESSNACVVECCAQADCGDHESCDSETGTCIALWDLLIESSLGGTLVTAQYADGATATVEVPAFPADCTPHCIFVEWQGDVPDSQKHDDPLVLVMDTQRDITALFQAVSCIEDSDCVDGESCTDNECEPCVRTPDVCGTGAEGCMMIGLFGWLGLRDHSRRVRR